MIDFEKRNKIDVNERALYIRNKIKKLIEKNNVKSKIAIIQVGNNFASNIYVNRKIKIANEIGISSKYIHFDDNITEDQLINEIQKINNNNDITGIMVQLPLPININTFNVLISISQEKDIDGLHPFNAGLLHYSKIVPYSVNDVLYEKLSFDFIKNIGKNIPFIPCTPMGCLDLLQHEKTLTIQSKNAVVIGNSNLVGKPISRLLIQSGATVTTLHSKSKNVEYIIQNADIIVSATGVGQKLKKVKKTAIIIDVAIRNGNDGKICGDLNYNKLIKTNRITPVPKGVGPMTIACLMVNSYLCGMKKNIKEN